MAGLVGNTGQQCRFKMPATVDRALQIATTVFEAETREKKNIFFQILKPTER